MFGKFGKQRMHVTLFGVKLRIGPVWMILAPLIAWSLAEKAFPYSYKGLSITSYWWMGVIGSVGLLVSIVFHELWHSLIARNVGISEKEVTVYIFGGVPRLEEEPLSAKAEFFTAAAGPIASLLLAGVFYGMSVVGALGNWSQPVQGVMNSLTAMNVVLALFNLVPAFPLDGGRMFRAALWRWKQDFRWATRLASRIGSGFGITLMILGLSIMGGSVLSGIWVALIGVLLRNASRMSYQHFLFQDMFEQSVSAVRYRPRMTLKHL
jgi:Zn-dependent protease